MKGEGHYDEENKNSIDLISLGGRLRKLRIALNYSQRTIADTVGRKRQFITQIENGAYMPSVITLLRIAKVLDFDLNELKDLVEIKKDLLIRNERNIIDDQK